MARYIEADAVISAIEFGMTYLSIFDGNGNISRPFDVANKELLRATNRIKELPSIDIVRCAECNHYTEAEGCLLEENSTRQADDFCSYGDRREP